MTDYSHYITNVNNLKRVVYLVNRRGSREDFPALHEMRREKRRRLAQLPVFKDNRRQAPLPVKKRKNLIVQTHEVDSIKQNIFKVD